MRWRVLSFALMLSAVSIPMASAGEVKSLVPLYSTFAVLQGLDVHSTREVLSSGVGREANIVMGNIAESPAKLVTAKVVVGAGIIALCEVLRRDGHHRAALFTMIGLNVAYGAVVAHNYALLGGQR